MQVSRCVYSTKENRQAIKDQICLSQSLTLSVPCIANILAQGLQRYNLPADWARKLFKPSTDSTSLLVEIEKKFFVLGLWFSGGGRHKWGVILILLA